MDWHSTVLSRSHVTHLSRVAGKLCHDNADWLMSLQEWAQSQTLHYWGRRSLGSRLVHELRRQWQGTEENTHFSAHWWNIQYLCVCMYLFIYLFVCLLAFIIIICNNNKLTRQIVTPVWSWIHANPMPSDWVYHGLFVSKVELFSLKGELNLAHLFHFYNIYEMIRCC